MAGDSGSSETTDEIGARAAIITVHGTGDSQPGPEGEKWWQRGSDFSGWLIEELASRGVEADIHPLIWTGANSATAREEASRALDKLVRKLAKEYDNVHVIGHSHGGNVANEAAVLLNWRGGRAGNKSARDRLRSISTVGTPFFQSEVSQGERFGAYGFGLMALVSAVLVAVLISAPKFLLELLDRMITTGMWTSAGDIESLQSALSSWLTGVGVAGIAALAFIMPIAWRGLMRIRRAGRRRPKAGLFSIWHPLDEAISFLQRVETLPIEPFERGSLWRGSRTGAVLWGVRAVFVLPVLGLMALAADWGLERYLRSDPGIPALWVRPGAIGSGCPTNDPVWRGGRAGGVCRCLSPLSRLRFSGAGTTRPQALERGGWRRAERHRLRQGWRSQSGQCLVAVTSLWDARLGPGWRAGRCVADQFNGGAPRPFHQI